MKQQDMNKLILTQAVYLKLDKIAEHLLDNQDSINMLSMFGNTPRKTKGVRKGPTWMEKYNLVTSAYAGVLWIILKEYDLYSDVLWECAYDEDESKIFLEFDYCLEYHKDYFSFKFIIEPQVLINTSSNPKFLKEHGIFITNITGDIDSKRTCTAKVLLNDIEEYIIEVIDLNPVTFV